MNLLIVSFGANTQVISEKKQFCGRDKSVLGAAETVCHFNAGSSSVAALRQECYAAVWSNSKPDSKDDTNKCKPCSKQEES